jgi:hypothetical protein
MHDRKTNTFIRSKVTCEPTLRCTSHQGSASYIQDVPHNTFTASYLAVESSFALFTPQGVLLEILSRYQSKYDEETMVEHNELPFHVLEKRPSLLKNTFWGYVQGSAKK